MVDVAAHHPVDFHWPGIPVVSSMPSRSLVETDKRQKLHRIRDILVSIIVCNGQHCRSLPSSLATRDADFGDGSTYITYRNVDLFTCSPMSNLLTCFLASHSQCDWYPWRSSGWLDRRNSLSGATRLLGDLDRYVHAAQLILRL